MAKKTQNLFICNSCGNEFSKWSGQCPICGAWNSFKELPESSMLRTGPLQASGSKKKINAVSLAEIKEQPRDRISTSIGELDRVLGGEMGHLGLVRGAAVLLAGEPGIGKSTILTQLSLAVANTLQENKSEQKVLYVSGEESVEQVGMRMLRIGESQKKTITGSESAYLTLANETNVDLIVQEILRGNYAIVIVDSIQTVGTPDVAGSVGSIVQVRESTARLLSAIKEKGVPLIVVGHVTKEGTIAGPRLLEHMVDVVLWFEGDRNGTLRILRGIKNRFGSTNEVGLFEMQESGLVEVTNPSEFFLEEHQNPVPGTAISIILEGKRPLLIEIQALVVSSFLPMPRRVVTGYDLNRVQTLLAVITKRLGIRFDSEDVYVNVVGGLRVKETAVDCAVCAALVSAKFGKPIPGWVVVGEVGLVGEIRSVQAVDHRISEAVRLGYSNILFPEKRNVKSKSGISVRNLSEVMDVLSLPKK